MKAINTRIIFDGAVKGSKESTIEATKDEIESLVNALKIVEKFKYEARNSLKVKETDADWTMYNFDILKSDGIVKIKIDNGACG
jgi:Holliday junction resolvase